MWTDKYIGRDYRKDFDCMDLAVLVARDELGVEVKKPFYDPNCWSQRDSLNKNIASVCTPAETPEDKQPVLFVGRKRFYHIGIYADGGWILHNDQNFESVILTRIEKMPDIGFQLQGYYRWK